MAVSRVFQREIVEIPFDMPNGKVLVHPALVISRDELQDDEDGMFYALLISSKNRNPKYTVEIKGSWLNKPMSKRSYFVTHILTRVNVRSVMSRRNNYIKHQYFRPVVDKIIRSIILGEE